VTARDEASPDLEALKARLEELKHTVEEARATVTDPDEAAKLDRAYARLIALGEKLDRMESNPKVNVAGAVRAEAEIHAVEAALDRLNGKEADVKVKVDVDQSAMGAAGGGALGGLMGLLGRTPAVGPLPAGAASGGAIAGIAAAAAAALPLIDMLVSGLAAAGAGALSFGILAKGAFTNVSQQYTALQTAQDNYAKALAINQMDPTKAHATALKNAGDALKYVNQQMGQMPAAEQGAIKGIQQLSTTFQNMVTAFEPKAYPVFNDLLKIANNLLPAIMPFATTFASALDGLLQKLAKFTQSKGFQDWVKQFSTLIGPAVTAMGTGIGKIGVEFGKLLTIFSGKDIARAITAITTSIAGLLIGVRYVVNGIRSAWDHLSQDLSASGLSRVFSGLVTGAQQAGRDVLKFLSNLPATIQGLFAGARGWLRTAGVKILEGLVDGLLAALPTIAKLISGHFPADVQHPFDGAHGWLIPAGRAILQGLIDGIISMKGTLAGTLGDVAKFIIEHKGPIEVDRVMLFPSGQAIMDGLMGGMGSRMPDLRSQLAGVSASIGGGLGAPGGYGGPGGGPLRIQLEWAGASGAEDDLIRLIRRAVRVKGGGNVQLALGR
jgi:hypothetical protein